MRASCRRRNAGFWLRRSKASKTSRFPNRVWERGARARNGRNCYRESGFYVSSGVRKPYMVALTQTAQKRFCLILVKPSHYDEDGYVIQWFRSTIPSNSLAAVFGLARDCAQRHVLGPDVEIEIHPFDETNTRIRPERLARMIEEAGAGMVMMIGVQSNRSEERRVGKEGRSRWSPY